MQRSGGPTDTVDCMAWLKKSSNGPVTVASLLERRVALSWQEGVALVLEIAEVFVRSGKRSVPRHDNLALTPSGTVEFRRGRTQSGGAVSALARTLNSLLPSDRPTQLRLLVSTAGPDSSAYKSVGEFVEALKYFERPGRRNLLSEVHARALTTPVGGREELPPSDSTPKRKRETRRRSRLMVPAVVVLLLAAVAGGASLMERTQPGSVLDQAEPLQSVASDAWRTALAATAEFRKSTSRDLSMVLEKMRNATEDLVGVTAGEAEADDGSTSESSSSESRRGAPPPDLESESGAVDVGPAVFGGGEGSFEADVVTQVTKVAAVVEVRESTPAAGPLVSAELFDSQDINVTPPVTIRLQLPTVADEAAWNEEIGVVEAIVSASGDVERVKLVSPPESVHQAMILSAIKTWCFRPAERDGLPVRYRHLIPVAIPR